MVKSLSNEELKNLIIRLRAELNEAELEHYRREIIAKQELYGVVLGESIIRITLSSKTEDFLVCSMAEHEARHKDNSTMLLVLRKIKKDHTPSGNHQYLYCSPTNVKVVGKFNPGQKSEIIYE